MTIAFPGAPRWVALALGSWLACKAPPPQHGAARTADILIEHADVFTMDPTRPKAEAVAIAGDRIMAVGTHAELAPLIGPTTQRFDAKGASVTPGLTDGHCHLYGLGVEGESISMRDAPSAAAAAEQVRLARVAGGTLAPGEWLTGRGWDQNKWAGQAFPTRQTLDALIGQGGITGETPMMFRRIDGHAVWVNSAALRLAGLTSRTPDPQGGRVLRDAHGEPTGVLIDNAIELVAAHHPPVSEAVRRRRLLAAAQTVLALGITSVHEMGIGPEVVESYGALAHAAQLPLRVFAFREGVAAPETTAPPPAIGRFALVGVKYFADGALGSRGARLHAPYTDDPHNHGLWVTPPEQLRRNVELAAAQGWHIAVHAIGDAGISATLDAFATVATQPATLRVEHAQIVAPADFARMKQLGAIASMQPSHATSDMAWAEARVGASRILGAYAWRTVLTQGIPLIFGSDFPIEAPNPLAGIYAAVTRQDAQGQPRQGWHPAQRLTLEEALYAFTRAPALAISPTSQLGHLVPGAPADLVVYDRQLTPDLALLATKVRQTFVAGQAAYTQSPDATTR